tara:strand:+ start:957 stop:3536 length:2580 start_codon:yes stop_codon:yes gene_type:complete
MHSRLLSFYEKWVLEKPLAVLTLVALTIFFFGTQTTKFKLDASAESLLLENDDSIQFYRKVKKNYGSDNFLLITFTPKQNLFSDAALKALGLLRNDLKKIERVRDVVSILDVPLFDSPKILLSEITSKRRTLETPGIERTLARKELLNSPIYKNMLLSPDGQTTIVQVLFKRDERYFSLMNSRNDLREKKKIEGLSPGEEAELEKATLEFREYHSRSVDRERKDVKRIRGIIDRYRPYGEMFLGGVGMIVTDMVGFIKKDLVVFGAGVLCFLSLALIFFFRQKRWVILPLLCCFISLLVMVGYLGLLDWRVTVISSNFTSLLLILTIALTIHLIVRYRDLYSENKEIDQKTLILCTVRDMFAPCFYTTLTTIMAFCSLIFSDIRPVIDFGWMMTIGIALAFGLNFIFFPTALMLTSPGRAQSDYDPTRKFTLSIALFTQKYGKSVLALSTILALTSVFGISKLKVENRFIDYFKSTTEIYQGMEIIDQKLGGTVPLDIVIDADQTFYNYLEEQKKIKEEELFDDPFAEGTKFDLDEEDLIENSFIGGKGRSKKWEMEENYWFHERSLERIEKVHDYLDNLPEIGKVQSIATTTKVLKYLNNGKLPEDYDLAIIRKVMSEKVRQTMISPYLSEDANQTRLTARIIESEPNLSRQILIQKIRDHLVKDMGFESARVRLTGMAVLYNNMLQSLYGSQIKTLGVVFVSILFMFVIVFRNFFLACIALVPNALAAGFVLGVMGLSAIPLDMMTITIAAITIGIAVDNSIHYVHRFKLEFLVDQDYNATLERCHGSIGKAIYYTSVVITLGFSILSFSAFVPTIYFGLLTGLAMVVALLNNLTLLPILIVYLKPLGPTRSEVFGR